MSVSLDVAWMNVGFFLDMIRDRGGKLDAARELIDVLVRFGQASLVSSLLDKFGEDDKPELYRAMALAYARIGDPDSFAEVFKKLPDDVKLEVLSEAIMEGNIDKDRMINILREYLAGMKSVDYNDEDVCYSMAIILSYIGDYTRARGFVNNFCSLIKVKEYTFMREFFEIMDELKCISIKMMIGDRQDGLRRLKKTIQKIENLEESRRDTIVIEICDVLSRYGLYDRALEFAKKYMTEESKSACIAVIVENMLKGTDKDSVQKVIEGIMENIRGNPDIILRLSILLRRYDVDYWRELFDKVYVDDLEKISVDVLLDLVEELADNDYIDMLDKISQVPIYWEDLREKPELLLKYVYVLYSIGKIRGGAKILEDYINRILITRERRVDPLLPAYYLKSFLVGMKRYPEILAEVGLDKRLQEKLESLSREVPIPDAVMRFLDEITDHEYKSIAMERIAEEILLENRCVGVEKILILVPEQDRLEDLICRVARNLATRGEITDALSCLNLIKDEKKKLDLLLAMEHRCALKLCKELPGLLKMTIRTMSKVKEKIEVDPVEEAKIRLDLAIVFKFAGKEKDYRSALDEAIKRLEKIKPRNIKDILKCKIAAESYGYYAAALYVLGDPRSDSLLKEALNYVNMIPQRLRIRTLAKIMMWLLFADWFSVALQLVQMEGMDKIIPLVRTALIQEYVRSERFDEALDTALSIAPDDRSKVETYINYAQAILRTPAKSKIPEILEKAEGLCRGLDDDTIKIRLLAKIAGMYARIGITDKAEEIIKNITEEANKIKDSKTKNSLLAEMAPALYLIEHHKMTS